MGILIIKTIFKMTKFRNLGERFRVITRIFGGPWEFIKTIFKMTKFQNSKNQEKDYALFRGICHKNNFQNLERFHKFFSEFLNVKIP